MLAAGEKGSQDAQIRICEKEAFRVLSGSFGGAHERTQMFAAGDAVKVFDANSREAGDFVLGEDFLTGFDGDHCLPAILHCLPDCFRVLKTQMMTPIRSFPEQLQVRFAGFGLFSDNKSASG